LRRRRKTYPLVLIGARSRRAASDAPFAAASCARSRSRRAVRFTLADAALLAAAAPAAAAGGGAAAALAAAKAASAAASAKLAAGAVAAKAAAPAAAAAGGKAVAAKAAASGAAAAAKPAAAVAVAAAAKPAAAVAAVAKPAAAALAAKPAAALAAAKPAAALAAAKPAAALAAAKPAAAAAAKPLAAAAAAKPAAAAAALTAATAGAAATATSAAGASASVAPAMAARYEGWLSAIADPLEQFLLFLQAQLRAANVPFPQGTSIVALTACVKLATFPFTKKQVESGMAMQNLQPQVKALRERWSGDENSSKLNEELNALYKRFGVNPLAGCFPVLLTLPVFWGLYRALLNGSADGAFAEPFWWVPSLAGPVYDKFPGNTVSENVRERCVCGMCVFGCGCVLTRCALRARGIICAGWPVVAVAAQRGRRTPHRYAPPHTLPCTHLLAHTRILTHSALDLCPSGWEAAQLYLVLPVALVISQYISTVLLPPTPPDADAAEDEATKNSKVLLKACTPAHACGA
jgi:YidC/Oxa1 family membrane protein insertase